MSIEGKSKILSRIFTALTILIPLNNIVLWSNIDKEWLRFHVLKGLFFKPANTPEGIVNLGDVKWTFGTKMVGMLGGFIDDMPFIVGSYFLAKLFSLYAQRQFFVPQTVSYYKILSWSVLAVGFTTMLGETFTVLAVTFTYPPGHRWLTLHLGSPTMGYILIGVVLLMIAQVMHEGLKLKQEQDMVI